MNALAHQPKTDTNVLAHQSMAERIRDRRPKERCACRGVLAALAATAVALSAACGNAVDGAGHSLTVESTSPSDGDTEVNLDKEIRVTFSHELDRIQPDDAITVNDEEGNPVNGRFIVDRQTMTFLPARYAKRTAHTVTLSSDVTAGGKTLGEDHDFEFTTGDATSSHAQIPPDAYDPLGRSQQTTLGRMPEFALAWSDPTRHTVTNRVAVEDPPYNPSPLSNTNYPSASLRSDEQIGSLGSINIPIAAQLDEDAYDEVAVVSLGSDHKPIVTILNRHTNAPQTDEHIPDVAFHIGEPTDVAAADFDGDGRQELLVVANDPGSPISYYLVDYTVETGAYDQAAAGWVSGTLSNDADDVRVAAGDLDADGRAEAVIAWVVHDEDANGFGESTAYYVVLDDEITSQFELAELMTPGIIQENMVNENDAHCHDPFVDVAVGDIDGDGVDEALFGLTESEYDGGYSSWGKVYYRRCIVSDTLRVADNWTFDAPPSSLDIASLPDGRVFLAKDDNHFNAGVLLYEEAVMRERDDSRRPNYMLHPADLDGDGRDEVVFHNWMFKFRSDPEASSEPELSDGWPKRIPGDVIDVDYQGCISVHCFFGCWCNEQGDFFHGDLSETYLTRDVRVGDVDGDLAEDIVLLRKDESTDELWIDHFDLGSLVDGELRVDVDAPDFHSVTLEESDTYFQTDGEPRLALPHVDGDSMIVERAGHDVYLSDNTIIAVVAAAPCSAELGQDLDNCSTQFGQGSSDAYSDGVYVNASAGVLVGLKWEPKVEIPFVSIKLMEVELEGKLGVTGSFSYSWITERSELISYTGGAKDNMVIFKTFVYDRYTYAIVDHPDPDRIDETMSISVPSGSRTMSASQDYYDTLGGTGIRVGDVIGVVPGDLLTYPGSMAQAEELAMAPGNRLVAMSEELIGTPPGESLSEEIELGVTHSESLEWSVGLYTEATAKACGPSANGWTPQVCAGGWASFEGGYANAHEWSDELIFAGSLSGIPEATWANENYQAGLFAYETTVEDELTGENQNFLVVNYFVEK